MMGKQWNNDYIHAGQKNTLNGNKSVGHLQAHLKTHTHIIPRGIK